MLLNKIQQVQDATGTAITIGEGVNRLELIMHHRHLDQRVQLILGMDKLLKIGQLVADHLLSNGWGINDLTSVTLQGRTGDGANADIHLFNQPNQFNKQVGIERAILSEWKP